MDDEDDGIEPTCRGCRCCMGAGYYSGDELRAEADAARRERNEARNERDRLRSTVERFASAYAACVDPDPDDGQLPGNTEDERCDECRMILDARAALQSFSANATASGRDR